MKKFIPYLFISALAISVFSCSSDAEKSKTDSLKGKTDSAKKDSVQVGKVSLQTDSGRLEIGAPDENKESNAVLYDANGKVVQTGMYMDNLPVGAWVKYDAAGNVISAEHYSAGKPSHSLDKNDFVFRKWENKEFGAGFSIPKNWKETDSPNPSLVASFEKQVQDTSVHVKPNINVAKAALQPGDNLEKLAQMQIQILHETVGRVELVEENYFIVDSCNAFRRYGMYYTADNKIGFLNVIIVSGDTAWFFSCVAENKQQGEFLKYQGVFQQIAESFYRLN